MIAEVGAGLRVRAGLPRYGWRVGGMQVPAGHVVVNQKQRARGDRCGVVGCDTSGVMMRPEGKAAGGHGQ